MPTKSHNFPSGWTAARLASLCDILIGGTPSRNKQEFWDADKSDKNVWVSIADLSKLKGKYISDSSEYISDEGVRRSNVKKVLPGTVLMSFKLSIGKVAIAKTPLFTNEAIAAFNIKQPDRIVSDYLYYLLPTLEYEADQAVKGKTLNKEKLNEVELTLPSLNEQKKIAETLSTVDDAIQKTNELILQIEKLKEGLTSRFSVHGKTAKLGTFLAEIGGYIQTGPFGSQLHSFEYVPDGIPVVMPKDIHRGRVNQSSIARISRTKAEELTRHRLKENDLVLSRRGDFQRAAAIGVNEEGWICGTGCLLLRAPKERLDASWLSQLYLSPLVQKQLDANSVGTTMKNLNSSIIGNLILPIPEISEQQKIFSILSVVDKKITIERKAKSALEVFKKGLMQDLLSGKVRV